MGSCQPSTVDLLQRLCTVSNESRVFDLQNEFCSATEINEESTMSVAETWGYGFLFVTIINLSSLMGIVFFPLMNKKVYKNIMRGMIGLAIGSLSGSALFHLIPKALLLKEAPLNQLAFVWLSVWVVMILESAMKIGLKAKKSKLINEPPEEFGKLQNNNPCNHTSNLSIDEKEKDEIPLQNQRRLSIHHSTFSLNQHAVEAVLDGEDTSESPKKTIKTVAWVIIFGDGLHNFIDGVSIGAAFSNNFRTGAVICLAIFCEEFPHELGDFAILITSGLSWQKALLFNFMSAITCYFGLVLGIILGELDWSCYIFATAAGIFLYVALGDMVPEVAEIIDEVSDRSPAKAWRVMVIHHIGILVGISILFLLAKYLPEG